MTSTILETPTKSETDKKDYRLIRLSNGLKVLLIKTAHNDKEGEAPKEKMAALAISVAVGGNHDPKEIKGLSHFLEHMVFMGSEKYPGENDFMQYLTNEGGSTNAFTTTEHTVFFFDSNEDAFVGAVDRLSQFFIAPLLLKDSVDRELESVESEYQMGVNSSYRRKIRIMLSLTHEDHQVNSFTIGNSTTLRNNTTVDEVYKNLDEHREKYYVANRMTLCIQTNYELDKMQELVEEYFVAIKSGDPAPVYDDNEYLNIFRAEFHEKMIYIKPLDTKNELTLTWILPHILRNYKCLANTYIENVFDYDGPGSLASYLKEKLLVIKFEAGSSEESNYSFFTLSLVLTSHGLQNIDEIMEAISSYCYLLQQTSMEDHEKLFNNIKELMDVDFKYAKENTEVNNVIMHSMRINFFPDEDILIGGRSFVKFDGAAISEIINILNDTKFNVLLMTKDYDNFDKKEKWYGTEYASVGKSNQIVQ